MLTHEDTLEIVARYEQERDRFECVASEVHRRVFDLLHGRVLKNIITSRAKSVDSLRRSLWRDRSKWQRDDFDTSLAPPLVDLAGVRVLLYQDADVEPARNALAQAFTLRKQKDKRSPDRYSALHLVVDDWCAEDEEHAGLRSRPCEIQICTVVEHVWNELEHDIKYKQPGGRPDPGQEELLTSLRAELGLCAQTVMRLMARTDARGASNAEPLSGPTDLAYYLRNRLGRRVDGAFEELWDFLSMLVNVINPRVMDDLFDRGRDATTAEQIWDDTDPDHAHRDVGLVTVMLLPAFPAAEVREAVATNPARPLWKFMLRVAGRGDRGTT